MGLLLLSLFPGNFEHALSMQLASQMDTDNEQSPFTGSAVDSRISQKSAWQLEEASQGIGRVGGNT